MYRVLLLTICSILFSPAQILPQSSSGDKRPDAPINSTLKVSGQEEFDAVSRVFHPNTPYAIPHVMFAVDRRDGDKIYFINSKRFKFHKDFLYATGLAPLGTDMFKSVYTAEDRRFIVGTLAWQKPIEKWTWEFWEGDTATPEHMKIVQAAIDGSFFGKVGFKPNSAEQESRAQTAGL